MGGIWRALRANPGTAAILSLGLAWGLFMHSMGWTQTSVYAQVRALASGTTQIDRWQWETGDKAWVDGHFYSVKAPGLAAVTLPAYLGLDAIGGKERARDAAATAHRSSWDGWRTHQKPPFQSYGFSRDRARHVEAKVANTTAIVWALTLLGAVLPAIGLLFMVRWVAERIEPGYGAAAAITLGVGTIVMTFASEYFDHIASAALGFAAFVLLFKEREGSPRLALVAAAGLMAGLAVCFEYPLGLLGIVLFGYALARAPRLRRGATYAAPRSPAQRRLCSTTSGRSGRLFASPTPTRWRCPGEAAMRCSASTPTASSASPRRGPAPRSTCCCPAAACSH